MSDQRETAPARLRQTTFGELAEGARFVTIDKWYLKTGPHHFEDGPNTWRCEDDALVVEIVEAPAGEADMLTQSEMMTAINHLIASGVSIEFMPWSESVGVNIRQGNERGLRFYAYGPDPLRAFSLAYAAYRKGQAQG